MFDKSFPKDDILLVASMGVVVERRQHRFIFQGSCLLFQDKQTVVQFLHFRFYLLMMF